jgi:beta-galactosidase
MKSITRSSSLQSGLAISAASVVSRTGPAPADSFLHSDIPADPVSAAASRERLNFDFQWKFILGSADDSARDRGLGRDQGDFSKTGDFQFAMAGTTTRSGAP